MNRNFRLRVSHKNPFKKDRQVKEFEERDLGEDIRSAQVIKKKKKKAKDHGNRRGV